LDSTCLENCIPLYVFTSHIKFFQIIINNNVWINDQTGDCMAGFWIEWENTKYVANVPTFQVWYVRFLNIWGLNHVGTWIFKICVWNLTLWVQFRSWEALVKNVTHVNLHGADCWTRLMWQPYHVITWTQWLQLGMKCMKCVVWYIRFFFYVSRVAFLNPLAYSSLPKGHGKIYILIWLKLVQQVPMNAWTWFGDFRVGALTCFMVWLKPKNSSTQLNLPIVMLGST